jgi:hypothetical protein
MKLDWLCTKPVKWRVQPVRNTGKCLPDDQTRQRCCLGLPSMQQAAVFHFTRQSLCSQSRSPSPSLRGSPTLATTRTNGWTLVLGVGLGLPEQLLPITRPVRASGPTAPRGQSLGVCTERVNAEAFGRGRLRTTPQVANAIHRSSSPRKIRS